MKDETDEQAKSKERYETDRPRFDANRDMDEIETIENEN